MECLVTGATGFIGGFLTKKLLHQKHKVKILRRKNSDISELKKLPIEHCIGDITDLESLRNALTGVHSVFHLAGKISYSKLERTSMENINVQGTENILQACKEKKIQRLVHVSSVAAVGSGLKQDEILNENSAYNTAAFQLGYSETKKAGEDRVIQESKKGNIDAVIVNPSVVYGPSDVRKSSRQVPLKIARGKFLFYTQGGISLAYIEDVVEGLYQAWKKGRTAERYILGGENVTLKATFQMIAKEAHVPPPRIYLPPTLLRMLGLWGDVLEKKGLKCFVNSEQARVVTLFHWFDSSKAKKELGFESRPAKYAISQSVKWMREKGLLGQPSDSNKKSLL